MRFLIAFCLAFALWPLATSAQGLQEERITFEPGTTGAVISGGINGNQIVDYLITAQAGQRMEVTFEPSNPSAYFNLLYEKNPKALHIGTLYGNRFSDTLPATGDYRVRVYLANSAARRGETAAYMLQVSIEDE
ncbi:MAG: hypothetical protein AAFY02_07280 [Pseudomonadota bacterium]